MSDTGMSYMGKYGWTHCALALALLCPAGCGDAGVDAQPAAEQTAPEATLAEQVADVQAGRSTLIQLEQTAVCDDDLVALQQLTALRGLLLDSGDNTITSNGLAHLTRLPKLTHLRIRGASIDDPALAIICKIESLTILNLPHSTITDAGLAELKNLPDLDLLRLGSPAITDAGMATIGSLPNLKRLHLIDVPITDRGLAVLADMEPLESLYIDGATISDAAWEDLFHRRPDLHVHINQEHHDRDPHKHAHGERGADAGR
jgi:hypothetical protein